LNLRDFAIKAGYFVLAPCPHVSACPMANVDGQWCHVRKRLHRSRIHMETKKATSGFEDEPYCYLVTSPLPAADDGYSRIINAPRHRPGHIYVDLCTPAGVVETSCVTKKNKGLFKEMKHAKWGDRELVLRQQ
jgi:ribosomal protein RSM22 (predicted rRNA methylase)